MAVKSEADLWDAYIVQQLEIPAEKLSGKGYKRYKGTKEPTQKQTKNYLIFLAKQLQRTTEVMLIEEMQPTWLRSEPKVLGISHQNRLYCLIWSLIWSLIWGLIMAMIIGMIGGLIMGMIWGLTGMILWLIIWVIMGITWGLIWGLVVGLISGTIEPIEELQISMSRFTKQKVLKSFVSNLKGFIIGSVTRTIEPN